MPAQLYIKIADDYNGGIELLEVDGPTTIYNAGGVKRFCNATRFVTWGEFTPIMLPAPYKYNRCHRPTYLTALDFKRVYADRGYDTF